MTFDRAQARTFYDRFGSTQDAQAFYEDAALDELIAYANFEQAENVFEFGCGTGRYAARLLAKHLPASAAYLGTDISQTMVGLAGQRLSPYGGRVRLVHADDSTRFPLGNQSVDRVIATYVLDLLSETDIRQAIAEAHRVLTPGGKLCLVSLTHGVTLPSRIVSALWFAVFRLRASFVGGCRPIRIEPYLDHPQWSLEHRNVVTQCGVPSEVIVARSNDAPDSGQTGRSRAR